MEKWYVQSLLFDTSFFSSIVQSPIATLGVPTFPPGPGLQLEVLQGRPEALEALRRLQPHAAVQQHQAAGRVTRPLRRWLVGKRWLGKTLGTNKARDSLETYNFGWEK